MRAQTWTRPAILVPLSFGVASASLAVVPDTRLKLEAAMALAGVGVACWSVLKAQRWLFAFFLCVLLTPPIPAPGFATGVQFAPALSILGMVAGAVRWKEWRGAPFPTTLAFTAFLVALTISVGFGALYSGTEAGIGSVARIGLFALGVCVFLYAAAGPRDAGENPMRLAAFLFLAGVAAALFGCADFYFHFPAPAGFGQQFVWLEEGVYRRAQGLFYEASTFGNLCSFFLVMIAVALASRRKDVPLPYPVLAGGGIVLGAGLILSYSRGSVVNLLTACMVLAFLKRVKVWRAVAVAAATAALSIFAVRALWPAFSASYWTRIFGSLQYFWYSPDGVLSGRVGNWKVLTDFMVREPWQCLFGIGYKTLPYSGLAGTPIIADNTYLSLLIETGVAGLGSFLVLNCYILKAALCAARDIHRRAAFLGEWIFCFWIGEMVQMLSGDLITYWRVLPVYFWVLGTAIRETKESA